MTLKLNFSTQLSNKRKLAQIAKSLGYVQTRGAKGEGSIRALLEAIIDGEVVVMSRRRTPITDAVAQALDEMEAEHLISPPQARGLPASFKPFEVEGELVSEMILRERR